MRRHAWLGGLLLTLIACGLGAGGEPPGCAPERPCFLQRVAPAGGWCPDGGGLLHWWCPHCFPRGGGPDDYCRKPPPRVCWPPCYPPWYTWGPPEVCSPPCSGPRDGTSPH
jgi:hypothetical protein